MVDADGAERVVGRVERAAPTSRSSTPSRARSSRAPRAAWRVRLRDASDELRGLLELVGLAEVLALEPRREPELGEELGVEEVVQPGDPAA